MTIGCQINNLLKSVLYLTVLFFVNCLNAQISPGSLSKAHAQLEGMSNCTQCHNLGDKISEEKCLNCHKELKNRVRTNKGYHSSPAIKQKSCITCHSEHHGLKFEMIRFDKKLFDHKATGYELKGAHKAIDCRVCHKPEYVQNTVLKKNPNTFLGLDQKCLTCHKDYHLKSLPADCAKCHTFEKFKPASNFNHQNTDFPLKGAHLKVDCIQCHKKEIRDGKEINRFAKIEFNSCVSCHKDEHQGRYGVNCKNCHVEESFQKIKTSLDFNHALTGFVLLGKHKRIDCKKCHDNRPGTLTPFKEFDHKQTNECVTCHKDIHESKFGTDCKKCHNLESFKMQGALDKFDHNLTKFVLEGKHASVDCKKCHTSNKMTDPIPHELCNQCHTDYHHGDFKSEIKYNDCAACHTVNGFHETSFGFDAHQLSAFKLQGAHLAIECSACHKKGKNWEFRKIGKNCQDCHQDKHLDVLDRKFYAPNQCANCHIDESWAAVSFDHSTTNFPLLGKHLEVQCSKCHFLKPPEGQTNRIQKFKDLPSQCANCHEEPHIKQFEESGVTDCKKCHSNEKWLIEKFNHDNTRFPLKGEHKDVNCKGCHEPVLVAEKLVIVYRNNKLNCKDCHK